MAHSYQAKLQRMELFHKVCSVEFSKSKMHLGANNQQNEPFQAKLNRYNNFKNDLHFSKRHLIFFLTQYFHDPTKRHQHQLMESNEDFYQLKIS